MSHELKQPKDVYSQHLQSINDIKFTRRQIDIISHLMRGVGAKLIAQRLDISYRTVETHIKNISQKLSLSGRHSIIDFFEKAGMEPFIRIHYQTLNQTLTTDAEVSNKLESFLQIAPIKNPLFLKFFNAKIFAVLTCLSIVVLFFISQVFTPKIDKELNQLRSSLLIPDSSTLLRRKDLINLIEHKFINQTGIKYAVIVGIAGAGKTTLARLYATQQKAKIVWEINAENPETLINEIENLAFSLCKTDEKRKELKNLSLIVKDEERNKKLVLFTRDLLKKQADWIIIYDNVESLSEIIKFLPLDEKAWGKGKVIITTRNGNMKNSHYFHGEKIISIDTLSRDQSLKLFSKSFFDKNPHELSVEIKKQVETFLKNIPNFPLDISLAASYLKITKTSFENFVQMIKRQNRYLERTMQEIIKDDGVYYPNTRASIISLTLNKLIKINHHYADLFLLISFLDSQNIPKSLLSRFKGKALVDNFIFDLNKYSLITVNSTEEISLHRSTHSILSFYMKSVLDLGKGKDLLEKIATVFKDHLAEIDDRESFIEMKKLKKHCKSFLINSSLLGNLSIALAQSHVGSVYMQLGNMQKAKKLLEKSIISYQKIAYENNPWYAKVLGRLGNIYRNEGKLIKCEEFLKKSLLIYSKNSYEKHVDYALVLGRLANLYRDQGHYKKAEQLLEKSLIIYKNNSYENHPLYARTLSWMGIIQKELGNFKKAETTLEECFSVYKHLHNESHPWIAWTLGCIASIHHKKGDYKKARQLLEKSLAIYLHNKYEEHEWTALMTSNLGSVFSDLGLLTKSKQLLEKSISIFKKRSFENNVWYAQALASYGKTLMELGLHHDAKMQLEKSISIYRENYAKDHPEINITLSNLGRVYAHLGEYTIAKDIILKSYKKCIGSFHPNHINIATPALNFAVYYVTKKDYCAAKKWVNEALIIFQKYKHPGQYLCFELLADIYWNEVKNISSPKEKYKMYIEIISNLQNSYDLAQTFLPAESLYLKRLASKKFQATEEYLAG